MNPITQFVVDATSVIAKLDGMIKALPASLSASLCLLSLCGCLSFGFKTERKSHFTDVNNNILSVDYGTEEREEIMPNGGSLKFDHKVRITLPEGKRVVLYQTLSRSGVRYHTPDNEYIFVERGPWCKLVRNGVLIYQGVFAGSIPMD